MNFESQKLSVREKIGYSLGDLAANLIFQTLVTFIVYYYTDVYMIEPSTAQNLILICGILGGVVFAPVMGAIADRTRTRWGKYRPWILWTSLPFGVFVLLAFTTPDFSDNGKIIYAFITYFFLVAIYTANNLPYSALSGVLTGNMAERNSLSSYRFVAVMVAQFIIQVLLLPLVLIAGGGDKAEGFRIMMMIFAVMGVVFFLITFFTTKERVIPTKEQESSVMTDLKDLIGNRPWLVMLILTILVFVTLAMKGGSYIYYFENYVSEAHLATFLENIGFNGFIDGLSNFLVGIGLTEFHWPDNVAASAFGLFNGGGIIFMIVGIGFSKPLADRFGKRDVFGSALFVSTLFILAFYFFPPDSIKLIFISQILHGFFYGITIPLLWAMIADVADYSEWKNNRRATALIFSAMILGLKAGLTFGSTLLAAVLGIYAYDATLEVQSPEAINGIKLAVSVFPAIPFLIGAGGLFFYEINKKMEIQIEKDLAERRNKS